MPIREHRNSRSVLLDSGGQTIEESILGQMSKKSQQIVPGRVFNFDLR